ncbi:MAG TPA: hypothetical protein DCE44_10780 [Verrucomicrobiales bacterium]|nr:hypothetical protein [Verrucomicrobiales bacterium]
MSRQLRLRVRALGVALLVVLPLSAGAADYTTTLKPLFRERCYSCHGALKQKAKLRLDTVQSIVQGGKSGPALVPGRPDDSLLLQRLTAADAEERMPPEHEAQPFNAAQVDALRDWITAGAPAPENEKPEADPKDHWAFRSLSLPAIPQLPGSDWVRNPVDAFLLRGYREHGLQPRPEAPRSVLVRRLYFDLLGVPPSAEELDLLEHETGPGWYERTVEQLLADPRYGERWARHWMDIWRYSDGWGLGDQHRNSQKHIWHWRDWIVESLNADLPYDVMIRLMLSADESDPNDLDRLRATGYLARNYFLFNRNQWMDETVEHVAKGFLGLTLNCAKCHDHKYDPFAQADYYRLRAVFEPYQVRMEMRPGEPDLQRDGIPRAYDRSPETPTYRFIRGQETNPDRSVVIAPGIPELLAFASLQIRPVTLPVEAWQPERRPWVIEAHRQAARSRVEAAQLKWTTVRDRPTPDDPLAATVAKAEVTVAERDHALAAEELECLELRSAWLNARWTNSTQLSETHRIAVLAERGTALAKLQLDVAEAELRLLRAADKDKESIIKERDAAREKVAQAERDKDTPPAPDAPLTPIVGAAWTPTRFLDSTKDDPAVEFVPTSTGRRTALAEWITDPRNPLTARVAVNHVWNRHFGAPLVPTVFDFGRKGTPPTDPELIDWLASDWVAHGWSFKHLHRRIVTSAAYRMSSSLRGAESELARDPDNRWWWRRVPIRLEAQAVRDALWVHAGELEAIMGGPPVPPDSQDTSRRRSLYFYHSNNSRNLFLTTFDDALVKECYRREQSIVPQQALALLNSRLVHEVAPKIAARLSARVSPGNDRAFVHEAFREILGFEPTEAETDAALKSLANESSLSLEVPDASSLRAREHLVWALINHADFVTLR